MELRHVIVYIGLGRIEKLIQLVLNINEHSLLFVSLEFPGCEQLISQFRQSRIVQSVKDPLRVARLVLVSHHMRWGCRILIL